MSRDLNSHIIPSPSLLRLAVSLFINRLSRISRVWHTNSVTGFSHVFLTQIPHIQFSNLSRTAKNEMKRQQLPRGLSLSFKAAE